MTSISTIFSTCKDRTELISALREYIHKKREEIRGLHRNRASGLYIVTLITSLTDRIISEIYNYELKRYESSHTVSVSDKCAVVGLGGYGRGELNPYSDIDIMFLYKDEAKESVEDISRQVLYFLWDLKYDVGHSVRTIDDCLKIGSSDFTVRTSLMEGRFITGNEVLLKEFQKLFMEKLINKHARAYIEERIAYMKERYSHYGSSIYLVEPNIKEGKGGLRDIHCLRWVIMARYGIFSLAEFHKQGYISRVGYGELVDALDFLLKVRNELHFHAGKVSDILSFDEQHRIAGVLGYTDEAHHLGVEAFMRDYYMHATHVHDISMRTIEKALPVSPVKRSLILITSRFVRPCFQLTSNSIHVPERFMDTFFSNGRNIVYLFYLSLIYGLRISAHTMSMLYRNSHKVPSDLSRDREINRIFRQIISWSQGVADILRQMHKVKVLQKIIPEFEKIYCYASYDYYHKYTVDEHSFLALEKVEELEYASGQIHRIFKEIKRRDILYLALLLHDIGKGSAGHHADIGGEIAIRVGMQLGYSEEDVRILVFLVKNHLLMSHIAFRRDLSEDKVIFRFAREVATPEILRKLFIVTYADIKAVGPDSWNEWKENLLTDLYHRTMEELSGTRVIYSEQVLIEKIKEEIERKLCLIYPRGWLDERLQDMESRYLLMTPPEKIINHLHMINRLEQEKDGRVLVDTSMTRNMVEFTIYTYDNIVPGLFSKIAGTLAAAGYNIMSAQVYTTKKGIVVDTFQAEDPYPGGVSSMLRQASVRRHIGEVLTGVTTVEYLFKKYASKRPKRKPRTTLAPPGVEIDNESSDEFTIIDVFATDKQGLLYAITKDIHELGLSVCSSKIATRVDQIVDVFYVKDMDGNKITKSERIKEIRNHLLKAIEEYCRI